MKYPLTIIIPARREEEVIILTLEELRKRVKIPHKIIIVNDSDRFDKTGEIVKKYALKYKNLSVIINRNNKKPSFASALLLGVNQTESNYIIPVMADLCDEPETIDQMYKKIQEGWDVVCGSRYMNGGSKNGGPFVQSVFSKLICFSLHYLIGIPTKDISNSFKMYKKSLLGRIIINPENGVEESMAIILQAYFQEAKITEVPTNWVGRSLGKSKFKISERIPKYFDIYVWALKKTILKHLKEIFGL